MTTVERIAHVLRERRRGIFPPALAFDVLKLRSDGLDADLGNYNSVIVRLRRRGAVALEGKVSLFVVTADGSFEFDPPDAPDIDPTKAAEWIMGVVP